MFAFIVGAYAYRQVFDRWAEYNETTRKYTGRWETNTTTLYRVVAVMGQYVKMELISRYANDVRIHWYNSKHYVAVTAEQYPAAMALLQRNLERQMSVIRNDAQADVESAQRTADAIADKRAYDLSVNTVTRALVHASDNGYCSETAVALISAGHKMPNVQLVIKATVLIPVEFDGQKDYIATRQIFGQTRGNIPGLVGEKVSDDHVMNRLRQALENSNASLEYSYYDDRTYPVVAEADVEFGKPVIRPLADVRSEVPAYAADNDNDY